MNPSLICMIIVGLVPPSLAAHAGDEGAIQAVDSAIPALQLVLEAAEHHADSVKQRTVNKIKAVRDGYVENLKNIQEQLREATQKLLSSYKNNYEIIKKNLQRNTEQIDSQIQPNFEESVDNFKQSLASEIENSPAAKSHLDSLIASLEDRANKVFATSKDTLSTIGDELENEYKEGLEVFQAA